MSSLPVPCQPADVPVRRAGGRGAILYDTRNIALSKGTGIATYSRELLASARTLGYTPWGLLHTSGTPRAADGLQAQMQLADCQDGSASAGFLRIAMSWCFGLPLGVRATPMKLDPTVSGPASAAASRFDRVFGTAHLHTYAHHHFIRHSKLMTIRVAERPRLFHATSPLPLRIPGIPNIYTIHDLIPILFPSLTVENKEFFLALLREIARTADHILTVSERSRQDIIRVLGVDEKRVTNTYQTIEADVAGWAAEPAAASVNECVEGHGLVPGQYFVFVGTIEPKKNISRLLDAYARSKSRYPLVVIGDNGWLFERDARRLEAEEFQRFRVTDRFLVPDRLVRRFPYLPRDELLKLVRGARALFFPSLYEGFGLPVLEAMQLGVPVMTSTRGSLPEITGDAALAVDPEDIAAMARAIRTLESDDGTCRELAARGQVRAEFFSVDNYRKRLEPVYGTLA